jgi:nucleotide-binding universal stress UspA family protein
MKTILVPTDFSDNAFHAAQYAALLAQKYDMGLRLANVFTIHIVTEMPHAAVIDADIERQRQNANADIAQFKQRLVAATELDARRIDTQIIGGFVSDDLLNVAKGSDVDMIVMGTRGASNWLDRWLGTNAQHIMQNAACPVWVIPAATPLVLPKEFLYASDFRGDEVAELNQLLPLLRPLEANCHVVHIHHQDELNIGNELGETAVLLRDTFKEDNLTVRNLNRRTITEGLENYLKNQKPHVLAVLRTERDFWEGLFLSSISTHFVQKATHPVLVFKAKP